VADDEVGTFQETGLARAIDVLREKVEAGQKITLKEASFLIWADLCVCSTQYLAFQKWARHHKMSSMKPWMAWKALFQGYLTIPEAQRA
jgi:hypothetical protein